MTHRPNAIAHTQEYTLLPGVVRHTFIIFGLFTTPNLCPPDTKSWRRHCSALCLGMLHICSYSLILVSLLKEKQGVSKGIEWLRRRPLPISHGPLLFARRADSPVRDNCRLTGTGNLTPSTM